MNTSPRCQLYLITPPRLDDPSAFVAPLAAACDAGGVASVQLRLKDDDDDAIRRAAGVLCPVVQERDIAFLMNDRPDLAVETGCDGVHIGQEDAAYDEARALVGNDAIVGVTCHASRHLAIEAADQGADYVAFGAFFDTDTKQAKASAEPEILQWWTEIATTPAVAIGGITPENCAPLVAAGVDFLAVVSAIWDHGQGPAAAVQAFNQAITETLDVGG